MSSASSSRITSSGSTSARVAWRCRQNVEFYRKLVGVLLARHRFDPTIYSYAVQHNDAPTLREWLRHRDDLLDQCGSWLDSTLVHLDPIERKRFEQLDYAPVVNQRTHRPRLRVSHRKQRRAWPIPRPARHP
jgi:hypothetical protein